MFPATFTGQLADYHTSFFDHVWSCTPRKRVDPYVAVWARGWAKSTCAEVAVVMLAALGYHYVLYCSGTQPQADDHVLSISERLASSNVAGSYPDLATARLQMIGERSRQLGWRHNRIWTASGFVVDALGLEKAIRGAKLFDQRPDVIILDDVDESTDSPDVIVRKIHAITRKILPAAAPAPVVLVLQNLVHRNGIVSQLVDGRADFLSRRILSGPHPAITGLVTQGTGKDARIIEGTPTWPSVLDIPACQEKISLAGLEAFMAECQHDVRLSGQPRFSLDALDSYTTSLPLPERALPSNLQGIEGLRVYALPIPGVSYVVYTDCAEGKGKDYTASCVMEARTRQLVAILEDNHREPQKHAELACDLWDAYNRGLFGFERAKGEAFALVLGQRGVNRIYEHVDNPLTPQQHSIGIIERRIPGFPMTAHTKRGLVDRLASLIEAHAIGFSDTRLKSQLESFIVTDRMTTEAAPGSHDDLVIALAGCAMLCEEPGAQSLRGAFSSGIDRISNVRSYTPRGSGSGSGSLSNVRSY